MSRSMTFAALFALTACADPALQKKVDDLEDKVAKLEEKVASGAGAAAAGGANGADDQALALYREAQSAAAQNDSETAKAKYKEILSSFGSTRVARAAESALRQLDVVGSDIATLGDIEWLRGKSDIDDGKATLVVFWEVWCPHCKREVPKLQETYEKYKGQGLNVISLTKMSRGKTTEEVLAFADESKVSYPIGKEDGKMSDFFGVQGVPAAAVVKGGKVVWRDHPARINDEMIQEWIKG